MTSLSDVEQAEIIEAFGSTSRCLDGLLNIDNRIYPPELQLNKAGASDAEAPFLDLYLSISNGFVSSGIYDGRDDFGFDMVNFPFLNGGFFSGAVGVVDFERLSLNFIADTMSWFLGSGLD